MWPLWFFNRVTGADWGYFNALSLVVRSSVHTYGRFPMHDPWVMGGVDLLANPQTRIFSPFGLFDQIFRPHLANLFSLVVHGALGAWGMRTLLQRLGHDRVVSSLGAMMFIGGSWFMLHYCEGHIPYGSMQLLPWAVYLLLELDKPAAQVKLVALLAFFVLDGGIYAFIFSAYAAIAMAAVGLLPLRGFVKSMRENKILVPVLGFAFLGVCAPKLVPVLDMLGTRELQVEHADMPLHVLASAFYDPDQWFFKPARPLLWRFHEVGCYLGFAATLFVIAGLTRPAVLKAHWRWLVFALIFLWIGTNWLAPMNPWTVISVTPLLRNAHVQPRVFIWFYVAFIILLCAAVREVRSRPWVGYAALAIAVLEIVVVSQRQWHRALQNQGAEARYQSTNKDITQRTWSHTVRWGTKPSHYFAGGLGSVNTYEPAQSLRNIRFRGEAGYAGEIHVMSGDGNAELREVSPGHVDFTYEGTTPAMVRLNLNQLSGWEVVKGDAEPADDDLSLDVRVTSPGEVTLRYSPWYWPDVVLAYVLGIFLFVGMALRLRHKVAV